MTSAAAGDEAAGFDLSTGQGRLRAWADFLWNDHAWIRLAFRNAHRLSEEMVRTNQPWPHQLARWKRRGVRTVINLRGGAGGSCHAIEAAACARLGLQLVTFRVSSREAPTRAQVEAAKRLFDEIAYPAVMHCKSGADRTGMMGALYLILRRGQPVEAATRQLGLRYLHWPNGRTGVLRYVFEAYRREAEPKGLSFLQWVQSPAYDPVRLLAGYRATRAGRAWDGWLRRE